MPIKMGEGMENREKPLYGSILLEDKDEEEKEQVEGGRYLTKADILLGKDLKEKVYIEKYDREVIIRPLTDGELTLVFEAIGNVPLNEEGIPDLNMVDISTNLKALRKVAAMGLVDPDLSEDDVSNMMFGVPGFLAKKILEISGLTETVGDEIKKFREERRW